MDNIDKNAIKKFAACGRNELIEGVSKIAILFYSLYDIIMMTIGLSPLYTTK